MESKEGKELERERMRGGKGEQGSRGREEGREICPILVPKGAALCTIKDSGKDILAGTTALARSIISKSKVLKSEE